MTYRADGWTALGDPTRRAIFERLADHPRAVGELARELPVSRPAVSQHRAGGQVYDRAVDGSECHWGRVIVYEPPQRLVMGWHVSAQWQLETDPHKTSEVEVRFVAEGAARTRVEVEHRHLDRHGEGWEQMR